MTSTDAPRNIIIRNNAFLEGKTYNADNVYPHSCKLYGGQATSQIAFGLYDSRQNNAVWRYDDYNNRFRIEKTLVLYKHMIPSKNNTIFIGNSTYRFAYAYIRSIQLGLAQYGTGGSISAIWKDNKGHDLLSRSSDGLTSYFGWNGSNSTSTTTYHSNTVVRGYTATIQSNGGGISLKGGVTATSSLQTNGVLRVGKTANTDGSTGWYFGTDGTAHVSREGSPAIYFHYNKAATYTNYLAEISSGTLRVQNNFDVVSALSGGSISSDSSITASSFIKAGGHVYAGKTDADDGSPGWFFSSAGYAHVSREGNAPAIYFHYNKAATYTNYLAETSSGTLKVQKNFNAGGSITAGAVTSYTPSWISGHTPADYHCVVSAGICSFSYRGPAVAHAANTQIGTLPVGARPTSTIYCPFVKMSGGAVGCMRIYTTGAVEVMMITDTASTGRLYFNCTFPVV